jgi:aminoglycoside 6'-N-acetyltransferase
VFLSFRPLVASDLPLLQQWLSKPHIDRWWREPLDLDGVRDKYLPRIDGREPTHMFVIAHGGRPIGWIQWYRWADYPEHAAQLGAEAEAAGIDLAIGEPEMLGLGLGSQAIMAFLETMVFTHPAISACISDPEVTNTRSCRAFEKAGFTSVRTVQIAGESCTRHVMRRDRPPRE